MSSKEILFVHPSSPMLEIQKMVPPLGSLQLTAMLRQVGLEPEILDIGDDPVPIERLIKADHLLFSSTTPQYSEALKIIKPILEEKRKSGRENPIIAIGGPHATYMKEKLLKDGWNYVCSGDGEEIIVSLIEGKIDKGLVIGKRVKDLNELPIPSYDILDPNTYRRSIKHKPTFPIMTSRGCPNNCAFCYKLDGRIVRFHSPDYVNNLAVAIKNCGVEQAVIYDDTFTLNQDRVVEICEKIKPLGITWRCNGSVNTLVSNKTKKVEMLTKMKEAGCALIAVGVDGPDQESLDFLEKGTKIDDCKRSIIEIKNSGILAKAYLVYIPGMGFKYTQNAKKFIKETEPDFIQLSVLMPIPGSNIYEHPDKYNIFIDKSKPDELYYQTKSGEFGDAGLLNIEDRDALDDINLFLDKWRQTKPQMPI